MARATAAACVGMPLSFSVGGVHVELMGPPTVRDDGHLIVGVAGVLVDGVGRVDLPSRTFTWYGLMADASGFREAVVRTVTAVCRW